MTTDTLDLPEITDVAPEKADAPALPADLKRVDLQAVALAQFGDWRGDVAAARKNLSTLALDLSIPARIADAKTLRHRIINTPRAEVRKVATALKSKLTAVSKAVGAEMDAAVAAYDEAESLITPQIEAAEQRIEDERIAREKAEAERLQALRATVDATLKSWMDRCDADGMTSERVALGISALGELAMPPELADVSAYWAERLTATRAHMERRKLALAQEELEAAQAKMRAEQERVAGIQRRIAEIQAAATGHERATAADLAEARAIVAALDVSDGLYQEFTALAAAAKAGTLAALDGLHAAAVEREARAAAAAAEAIRVDNERRAEVERVLSIPLPLTIPEEFTEGQDSQQVLKAEPETADATDRDAPADTSPCVGTMGVGQAADAAPAGGFFLVVPPESTVYAQLLAPATVEPGVALIHGEVGTIDAGIKIVESPTLTLGAINEWLAPIRLDSAGLESLGFPAAGRRKAALLYHDTDKPAIVAALVKHLQGLR